MEPAEWLPGALVLLVVTIFISSTWNDFANMRHHSEAQAKATPAAGADEKKGE